MFVLHWALQVTSLVCIDVTQRRGEVLAQGPGHSNISRSRR